MKPSQIASLLFAVALAALGVLMQFKQIFPAHVVPWFALGAGIAGAIATQILPAAWTPAMMPPHVAQVLSRVFAAVTATLGAMAPFLAMQPNGDPKVGQVLALVTALLGAIGGALLPHEAPKPAAVPA